MESKVMTITPEMAKKWLILNDPKNRKLNLEAVRSYARVMRGGGWNLTHQGIAFDTDGILIDGQTRLNAIVQANVPVDMLVTYGVERHEGSAFTIDTGRIRTTNNIIQMSGIDDPLYTKMSGTVRSYMKYKVGRGHPSAAEIIDYIDRHHDSIKLAFEIMKSHADGSQGGNTASSLHTQVRAALIAAVYRGESRDALEKFVQVYTRNDTSGCGNYTPRYALNLRDKMRGGTSDVKSNIFYAECAIFAFAHNNGCFKYCETHYPYKPELDA